MEDEQAWKILKSFRECLAMFREQSSWPAPFPVCLTQPGLYDTLRQAADRANASLYRPAGYVEVLMREHFYLNGVLVLRTERNVEGFFFI